MSSSIKLTNANKWLLIIIFAPVLSVSFTSFIFSLAQTAVAQESEEQVPTEGSASEEAVFRRVEIWGLFYRLMVIAFTVGAVVQGVIIYICWRFRESNKKNQPREPWEGMHR
jgi:heme/copper-type cytochrome/quinol oxidase subunit 2